MLISQAQQRRQLRLMYAREDKSAVLYCILLALCVCVYTNCGMCVWFLVQFLTHLITASIATCWAEVCVDRRYCIICVQAIHKHEHTARQQHHTYIEWNTVKYHRSAVCVCTYVHVGVFVCTCMYDIFIVFGCICHSILIYWCMLVVHSCCDNMC